MKSETPEPNPVLDTTQVRRVRKQRLLADAGRQLLFFLTCVALYFAVVAAVDLLSPLSRITRLVLAVAGPSALVAIVAGLLHRTFVRNSPANIVALMEESQPELGQKLRTAVEVADKPSGPSTSEESRLCRLLIRDSVNTLEKGSWKRLVPVGALALALVAAVATVGGISALAVAQPAFRFALYRAIAPQLAPTYTQVEWTSVPKTFNDRNPPRLVVSVSGRPADPVLYWREEGSFGWQTAPLAALPDGRSFDAILTGQTTTLEAYVSAGDDATSTATLTYIPTLKLIASEVAVSFPDYIGRKPEKRQGGDVKEVEGSTCSWSFSFNFPPTASSFVIRGAPAGEVPVKLTADGPALRGNWTLPAGRFTGELTVKDEGGNTLDTWKYEITGLTDEMPKIEIVEPTKESSATPVGELPVRIRARDDHGVAELGLILEAGSEKTAPFRKSIEVKDLKDVTEMGRAMLESVPLNIRDNVRLYAYATDHMPRNGRQAVSSMRAIDIRQFKIRSVFDPSTPPPGGGGAAMAAEQLKSLEQIVKEQRAIVSDTHLLRAEVPYQPPENLRPTFDTIGKRQNTNAENSALLHAKWQITPGVEQDDLLLFDTAKGQMLEAFLRYQIYEADPAFATADRALSTLLQLRKNLMKKIMRQLPKQPGSGMAEELGKKLNDLAKEAERLAKEEKAVREQITPGSTTGSQATLETSRRQQEVAVADAGELYAAIISHPDRNDGMVRLMSEAEKAMREADDLIHQTDPLPAIPPLALAERTLLDLAEFLRAQELSNLSATLSAMAVKAEADAKKAAEAAAKEAQAKKEAELAQKKEQGKDKPGDKPGEGEKPGEKDQAKAEGKKPGEKGSEGEGKKPGDKGQGEGEGKEQAKGQGEGQKPGEGKGEGDKPGPGQGGESDVAQAARNASLADEILKSLADEILKSLSQKEKGGDKPGEGEGEKPGEPGQGETPGDIAALRERVKAEALAAALAKQARESAAGKGPESGKVDSETAAQLENMAKELKDEAKRQSASRLARLGELKAQAKAVKDAIAKAENQAKDDKDKALLERLAKQGVAPGTMVSINGRKLRVPELTPAKEKGEGEGKGAGEPKPGETSEPKETASGNPDSSVKPDPEAKGGGNSGGSSQASQGHGPAVGRFVVQADRLRDDKISVWTKQLEHNTPEMALQAIGEIEKRLEELIAALPGGGETKIATNRVPEANRREVEDYFKNLSDDLDE